MPRALLVHPRFAAPSFWNYQATCEVVGARYSAAPLGLITVAGLLPRDWDLRLVDCNVEELQERDLAWADVVMAGGMMPQRHHLLEVVRMARAAGKPVVVGGADPTVSPEVYAEADFIVLGEAEDTIALVVGDIERGATGGEYAAAAFPDVSRSSTPRFDLLKLERYMHVGVQFSRGCPFDCEFCNIIDLNGRRPRTKAVAQVLGELEALLATGYRGHVDFVDDNFVGNRREAKALLRALAGWLASHGHPFELSTEASVDLGDDPEMLALMQAAGFFAVFVGIETPDAEALLAAHKRQNTRRDLGERIRRIHRAGIFVNAGFIVGFDVERRDIAEAMVACIEATSIPVCMVGLLYALPGTRLARRLASEGRLREEAFALGEGDADQCTSGLNFDTVRPRAEVLGAYRTVLERIYSPQAYFGRVRRITRELDTSRHRLRVPFRHARRDLRAFGRIAVRLGRDERTRGPFFGALLDCALHNPRALRASASFAALYLHVGPFSTTVTERLGALIEASGEGDRAPPSAIRL